VLLQVLGRTYHVLSSKDGNPDENGEVQVPIGVNAEEFLQGIAEGTLDDQRPYAKGGKLMMVRIHSAKDNVIGRIMKEFARRLKSCEDEVCIPYDFTSIPYQFNCIGAC
jgi:hypothetical protein